MSRNTQFYSQANHSVLITAASGFGVNRVLKDFASGNCIGFKPNSDAVAVTEGFDGARISFSTTSAGQIIVKLKPTSSDVGFLTRLYNLRKTNPVLLNVTITTGVNEIHKLINCGINVAGGDTGDNTMSEREFQFTGEELKMDESE